jgi:penicillin amidase
MATAVKYLKRAALVLLAALVVVVGAGYLTLRASLPRLDGELKIAGLSAAVAIERDVAGVPTIHGANQADVTRALGFLHAQERYFQMDLLRRVSAGELSELVGAGALAVDKKHRVHRFRSVARAVVARLTAEQRGLLDAYAEGQLP